MKPPIIHQSLDPRAQQANQKQDITKKGLLDRAFDRIIGSQLDKIKAAKIPTEQEDELYQQTLERERTAASKRKSKKLSKEHEELARTTGLSGQVVALMAGMDEKKSKKRKKRENRDSSSSTSEDSGERRRRRRKQKERKRKYKRSDSDDDSSATEDSRHRKRQKKEMKRKLSKSRSTKPRGEEKRKTHNDQLTSDNAK